jgi:hypothetical protein
METIRCGQCGGEGRTFENEGGREVEMPCYHCSGSGKIDAETAFSDRVGALAGQLARATIARRAKATDAAARGPDGDGEGWGFAAAENMMSVSDYTVECEWAEEAKILREFETLSRATLTSLLACLFMSSTEEEGAAASAVAAARRTKAKPAAPVELLPALPAGPELPENLEDLPF